MSRKIIGVTVGSPLPKPNLMQADPTKGDYVKGKDEFIKQVSGGNVENGEDGFSPIAKVEQTGTGAVISITDKDGTTTATITNGKDGKDGADGQDGYTPQKGIDYFDGQPGKDGVDGKDGYTPVKGVDYFDGNPGKDGVDGKDGSDGYTPVKGKDYFDGKDGEDGSPGADGSDGITPHIGSNGNWFIGNTDTGKPSRGADGQPGQDGSPGKDGSPGSAGKDGTSVTVESVSESTADGGNNVVTFSDGKTLTVKNGKTGAAGKDGVDGNTSVKVVTKADYSALTAEFVKQLYSDGIRLIIVEDGYTNLVPKSTDANGNIYRGCGYLNGYRLTSSGDMAVSDNCCVSGFMPYTHGSTIRIVGSSGDALSNAGQYVGVYDAIYNLIKMDYAAAINATWEPRADGLWEMTIDTSKMTAWSSAKYFRVSCSMCVGADLVVTVNEPIGLEV